MRLVVVLLALFAVALPACCSRVPQGIEKSIVFIYKSSDGAPNRADGTGFLVGIPVPGQSGRFWPYLVTAQHVLHVDKDNLSSPYLDRIYLRMNKKSGDSAIQPIDVQPYGVHRNVFLDAADVDVAVFPLSISLGSEFDGLLLPEDMLVTEEDLKTYNIGVGTDMFFTGMFAPYQGNRRNVPIVRFGRLAMLPDEPVPFNGVMEDAYLVETFSFGGNSGSPVFFFPGLDNDSSPAIRLGPRVLKLAGVMQGFFGDLEPIVLAQRTAQASQPVPAAQSNSGIAVVIPAQHIRRILHSEGLEHQRQIELKELNKNSGNLR